MTRMSVNMPAQDHSAFDGRIKASIVIAAIAAAVLVALAVTGSNPLRPAQATAHSSDVPELRAPERNLQRSGTLSGYRVLL